MEQAGSCRHCNNHSSVASVIAPDQELSHFLVSNSFFLKIIVKKVKVTSANSLIGFPAETETHAVSAVIPRHRHVTFLNCNTHIGPTPSSGIVTLELLID